MYTGLHAPLTISSSGGVTTTGDSAYSVTRYDYDRYSRLVKQTDPLGKSETYTYDLNGNLTQKTDRRGVTTSNNFDAMGRMTRTEANSDYFLFSYTSSNQLREVKNFGKTTTYSYDGFGRLISEETPYATKTFTYNIGDLRTGFKVADDTTVYLNNTYTYDKLGRLTKVNGSSAQATYTYDANGNLSTTTYNNNTSATYTYNSGNLPTQVQNKRGSTVLSRYNYTYGLDGNQLTKSDNLSRTTTYTYDGLNRLTKEAQTGTGAFTNSYTYDDYSNRATATLAGAAASYTYDANNRLLTNTQGSNTTNYTYDNQGNMTRSVLKYTGTEQNTVDCTYDGFNRLKKVSDNSGETVYTYDADGRRSSKQTADGIQYYVWDGNQLAVTIAPGSDPFFALTLSASGKEEDVALTLSVGTTYYAKVNGTVYSAVATHNSGQADLSRGRWDDTEIPEVPPDPKPETFTELEIGGFWFSISDKTGRGTVYGPGGKTIELYTGNPVSLLPTVSYVRGLSLVAAVQDGVRTYYHYNAHGDVVQLTNSSGTVTKNYTYDAFGVEKNAAASDANPFRYCGEQFDSETGNYYLRARYYSPGVGRFTQEDPIMDGLNWYTYCAGNPVAFVDPLGLKGLPWSSVQSFLDDFTHDNQGITILFNWLYGGGKERNYENDKTWGKYMTANNILRNKVGEIMLGYYGNLGKGETENIDVELWMEIENGEQMIGYQYLHGTNADVGGFRIVGKMQKFEDNSALIQCTYQWNDKIDPNFIYDTDSAKAQFAKSIPFANPTDYIIRISWYDMSVIGRDGNFSSGWFAGKWKFTPSPLESALPSQGDIGAFNSNIARPYRQR